ncbi:MAG TPA: VOC family protein [Byssovorax sp.]|jgi:hypothetical protein
MSTSITSGRFVWHELVTPEPKAALGFYGELLGWTSAEMDMGPAGSYTILKSNGVDVGGALVTPKGSNVPPSWLAYCSTDDVDAAAAKATKLGGKVMMPATDIPKVGRFAVVLDAQGAALAPFKPSEQRPETNDKPADGTFCWDELLTSDPKAALAFYRDVYGWTSEDKDMGPMGTYHMLKRGDRQAAGIMKTQMPGQPSAWLSYVAVSDVDESAKRAERLKGKVIVPGRDIPGIGRFAVLADREGAVFAVFKGSM